MRVKPGRYMGFIAGHGKESGFCSKCSEGHLDIKRGRTMRSMLPFKEIALNPATLCLDSYVCTSAPLEASESIPPPRCQLPVCLPTPVQVVAGSQHVPQRCSQSAAFPLSSQHPDASWPFNKGSFESSLLLKNFQ